MANYASVQAAIDAGITNMTVNPSRNNVKNDDGLDTIATGITWFYFNGVQVTNLYVSGNTWIGFGTNSEQLKVNRLDTAVWYEYTETGTINNTKFYKLRWCGYSLYSQTSQTYKLEYDVFLLDNGSIYLNWYAVPTSNFGGTCSLTADNTVTFSTSAGVSGEWTFTPSDPATGKGWSVATGKPNIACTYKNSGSAIYTSTAFQSITNCRTATMNWVEDKPENTSVSILVALSATTPADADYTICTNGNEITSLTGTDMSDKTLFVKVLLSTSDNTKTPSVSNMNIIAEDIMVQEFISTKLMGTYKVYCDITDKVRGITVINKKTSRLSFATTGEKLPVFSVHMFIEGQSKYIDGGYIYEIETLPAIDLLNITENPSSTLWVPLDDGNVSENIIMPMFDFSNVVETPSIILT